ncbi:hypothetical protein Q0N25_14235, partial [Staphylococcus aureus]|nr:hypothetical protein [Staphylococcus aureus]
INGQTVPRNGVADPVRAGLIFSDDFKSRLFKRAFDYASEEDGVSIPIYALPDLNDRADLYAVE